MLFSDFKVRVWHNMRLNTWLICKKLMKFMKYMKIDIYLKNKKILKISIFLFKA